MVTPTAADCGPPCSTEILDTAAATGRVLGDGALYLRMLRRFSDDHPAGVSPIRAALANADLGLAHRLAHTLKGTAGMIGARILQGRASVLEHDLRTAGAHAAAVALDQVEHALGEVLAEVARVLAGQAAVPSPRAAATPSTARAGVAAASPLPLLLQLAALLDVGDGAALDLLEEKDAAIKAALGAPAYSELMLAAHAFEFEAALSALQGALPAGWLERRS